ncbi:urea transporter 2-like [Homarus americanus]|uniref:urea transporter 2-like n=1 Tax=Homarus americanus TaxID=6706 RepID=UPI001C43F2DD|nr:urea transporter 2-like [Homarus americanus]
MADFVQNLPGALAWVVGDAPAARDALAKFSWKSPAVVVKVLDSVLRGIAQVAFGNNPISGLLILIGLFVGNVMSGLGAVVCSLTSVFVAKLLCWQDDAIAAGHSNFNAVLIGTVSTALYPLVFHTPLSPAVWGYIIVAAMFTVCVMAGLGRILEGHNIPAYTLPFNIAISTTFLCMKAAGFGEEASPAPSEEPDTGLQWDQVFLGTLLSAGHVWAVESVACSVLVLLGLFIFSPTLTLVSYLGATLGTLTGLVVSSAPYTLVYHGIWGYNGFLAAGSIAFFMAPTPRVILVAAINAVFATYLQAALIPVYAANGLPVFTFPFCLASVLFLATAMAMGPSTLRVTSPSFPELHLVQYNQKSRIVATKDNRDGDETTTEPMV